MLTGRKVTTVSVQLDDDDGPEKCFHTVNCHNDSSSTESGVQATTISSNVSILLKTIEL